MDEGFQNPSKYSYYTRSLKGFAYDSRYYGRTMFDIWPMEDSLQHQRVYFLLKNQVPGTLPIVLNAMPAPGTAVGCDDARTYQKIAIETGKTEITAKPGQKFEFDLTITNPYPFAVNFTNSGL
jgi:hypothetical protein